MSEMKMSDVFKLPMVQGSIVLMSNDHRYVIEFDNTYSDIGDQIEHVAHAINNHDRMVEDIAELNEFVKKVSELGIETFHFETQGGDEDCFEYVHTDIVDDAIELLTKLNQEWEE